ncbi:hypothetical protein OH799_31855 [Nocardia sp. NBC_00881]|uniref:DUF6968 family protein n=1 Tax=Nocardia sp. NBC_00881 TaxID=2975995 RepID=UPI0038685137|nr:hypothetical protein OH799_31855 [Nocardia sp. NBC_00881]
MAMQMDELGEPIASRELRKGDQAVTVTFGKPVEDDGAYSCGVRIDGMDPEPFTRRIYGGDAVQALLLAMAWAGRLLDTHEDGFTFDGSPDLGFPPFNR